MTTYYCRQDGTETNYALATINSAAGSMSLATLNTAIAVSNLIAGDIIIFTSKGGEYSGAGILNATTNSLSFIGETGFTPTFEFADSYRFKIQDVSYCIIENMLIQNASNSGIEWTDTGTGHTVRDVTVNGSTNQCFSNELTAGTLHAYNLIGYGTQDAVDGDGWSSHAGSTTYVYDSIFYNNNTGVNIVQDAVLYMYNCTIYGNDEDALEIGGGIGARAYFYDCVITGSVVVAPANSTTVTNFDCYRCTFNCTSVSVFADMEHGTVALGNGNATREVHSKFYSCLFTGHPGGSNVAQLFARGNASSTNYIYNCTFAQPIKTGYAIWDLLPATTISNITNSNMYNATVGVHGAGTATQTHTNCNFDTCTADRTTAADTTITSSNGENIDSNFTDADNSDFTIIEESLLNISGNRYWTYSNPSDINDEPLQDTRVCIGAYQTLGPFHPINL